MLTQENISEILFGGYSEICKFIEDRENEWGNGLLRRGIPIADIANEAIICTFDKKFGFENESELWAYIYEACKTISITEKEALNDKNFRQSHKISMNDFKLKYTPSDAFIKIYEVLSTARYGKYEADFVCAKCGGIRCYNIGSLKNGSPINKCASCGIKNSVTSKTYFNSSKLPFQKLYKLVIIMCQSPGISSHVMARQVKVTQRTAYFKMRTIHAVLKTENTAENVMSKLLTSVNQDNEKLSAGRMCVLDIEKVEEIRLLYSTNSATIKELAEIYSRDTSTIRKIIKGKTFGADSPFIRKVDKFDYKQIKRT